MKIRIRTDHDTQLRDPGRRLAGERPVEAPEPEPTKGPSPQPIRARRARLSFTWPARRTER